MTTPKPRRTTPEQVEADTTALYQAGRVDLNLCDRMVALASDLDDANAELATALKENERLQQYRHDAAGVILDMSQQVATLTRERDVFRKAEKETSDAYLRIREKLNVWETPHAPTPEQVYEYTEKCLDGLLALLQARTEVLQRLDKWATEAQGHDDLDLTEAVDAALALTAPKALKQAQKQTEDLRRNKVLYEAEREMARKFLDQDLREFMDGEKDDGEWFGGGQYTMSVVVDQVKRLRARLKEAERLLDECNPYLRHNSWALWTSIQDFLKSGQAATAARSNVSTQNDEGETQ